jgi:oxygen-independent coproporphyrinogen-3 oxidase
LTLSLINTPYKYEIEAVLKIFFPRERFKFIGETPDSSGDYVFIKTDDCVSLTIKLNSKTLDRTFPELSENAICKELYNALSEMTGITSPWGIMTGIRPVRRVNDLINAGKSEAEIKSLLKTRYLLSDEKFALILSIAKYQQQFLRPFEKRAFSLYVGIPFCPSRCSYCSFVSHSVKSPSAKKLMRPYAEKLCEELDEIAAIAKENGLFLKNIYIGGGTPTSLFSADLDMILGKIEEKFDILGANEYTVEAGRPDTITPENLKILKKRGISRISVNPQTMNDDVLAAIGRNHTAEDVKTALGAARDAGFGNINTDLITGLPTDTEKGFRRTLDEVIALSPESITVHTLTLKRSSSLYRGAAPAGKSRANSDLSSSKLARRFSYCGDTDVNEDVALMTNYAEGVLPDMGYYPYYLYRQKNTVGNLENVGFSKKGFHSLYNVYIMEETETILAAGAGASTKLVSESGKIDRVFNYKYPYEYLSDFGEILRRKSIIRQFYEKELYL